MSPSTPVGSSTPVDPSAPVPVRRLRDGRDSRIEDRVAVERPLEIRLRWTPRRRSIDKVVTVTMRTPGDDEHLARGFLFNEGVVDDPTLIDGFALRPGDLGDRLTVDLRPGIAIDLCRTGRNFAATASCGVCGKTSLEAATPPSPTIDPWRVPDPPDDLIASLPNRLRHHQPTFDATGGLHGCGLWVDDAFIATAEDVGRHNALDKLIGRTLDQTDRRTRAVAVLSGRVGYELVQKTLAAGIPMIVAVGAPTSLAVEIARRHGQRLIGFCRRGGFNEYTG